MSFSEAIAPKAIWLSALASPIGRREIILWTAAALFGNQVLQLLDFGSLSAFRASLDSQNGVLWFAGYAFFFRVGASSGSTPASRSDLTFCAMVLAAICLTSFLPYKWGTGIIATTFATYLLFGCRNDRNLRAAGFLLSALAAHLIWGQIIFRLLTLEIVRIDADLVGWLLGVVRPDIVRYDTTFVRPDGNGMILIGACSSFENISTALLACVAMAMYFRTEWERRDAFTIALAIGAMIATNTMRLCVLAWDTQSMAYYHDGDGARWIWLGQSVLMLLIAFFGARPRRRPA